MSQSIGRRLRYGLRGPLIKLLLRGFARLSLPVNHRIGAALGRLLHRYSRELRRIAETNVRLCFPELDTAAQERLVYQTLVETGKTMTELGPLWLWDKARVSALVNESCGEEVLSAALAEGRGAIMVSPHLGAWEIMGLYLSIHYGITSMYKPPHIEALNGVMRAARERTGARLVPTDAGGVRSLMQALKKGGLVGLLPDQDPGRGGGEFAPFFGIDANTVTLVSRLAQKSRAPVIFCYAERLADGAGFRPHFHRAAPAIAEPDLAVSLRAMNEAVEALVRSNPSQYQWSYRRFRTRPEGAPAVY